MGSYLRELWLLKKKKYIISDQPTAKEQKLSDQRKQNNFSFQAKCVCRVVEMKHNNCVEFFL